MNKEAELALTRARVSMIIDQPFFGNLALRLVMVEAPYIPTLAVDGKRIYYNPDFVLTLEPELQKSAVAHEVMHCVLDHINRRSTRDRRLWNVAGDFRINYDLKAAGFRIGKGWLFDNKYANLSTDHIYELLKQEQQEGKGPDGSGQQPTEEGGVRMPGIGDGPDDAPDGGERGLCDILPSEGEQEGDEAKAEQEAMEWQIAVAQSAQNARMQGKLPAHIERLVGQVLGGKVDWRPVLWRFADEVSKADYSWTRPNRKYLPYEYILPSLHSPGMGTMVVLVDTSGSIDGPILDTFGGEMRAIKDAVRPREMYVVYVDAAVQRVDHFEEDDELVITAQGGGGTDFRPAFRWIEEQGINPACAIYLTDMYGAFPKDEPSYPVLWCATTDQQAPWGETVRIEV